MAQDNKLTVGLVVVVGLLAVVAIIISAVSLSKNMPPAITVNNPSASGGAPSGSQGQGQGGQQPVIVQVPAPAGPSPSSVQGSYKPPMGPNGRIFTFQIGFDYGSHEYINDEGYLDGFAVGLLDLVCEAAEMDCRVMLDLITNAWDNSIGQHAVGGQGLHGRWYSGGVGYYTTVERSHVFQFSQPYLKQPGAHFYVLPTKSFDTSKENILNSKIVFVDGWASDEKCLARVTEAITNAPNIIYAKTTEEGIRLLSNGYDAIFCTATTFRAEVRKGILKIVGPKYSCMLAGNAIMSRKDSDVSAYWNRGFRKLKNNGRFKKYCEEANAEHIDKGTLECIDSF